jgi:hypothetical protein
MSKRIIFTEEDLIDNEVKRFDIINHLIKKYKFTDYLEIGVSTGQTFEAVNCKNKIGVDPGNDYKNITYNVTSDEFFETICPSLNKIFGVIFIDGLHINEQVQKDINNSLKYISNRGFIVLHDCNPLTEKHQTPHPVLTYYDGEQNNYVKFGIDKDYDANLYKIKNAWNGDVWKAFVHFRQTRKDLSMFTVDTDWGLGIIHKGAQKLYPHVECLDYNYFDSHRQELLNLKSTDEFFKLYHIK